MNIASTIDHTLLKPEATQEQITALCQEAAEYCFASVCVNSGYVPLAHGELTDSEVKVCSVVGFPLGAMSTAAKVFETEQAIRDGADEIDMVINVGWLQSGDLDAVRSDIAEVRRASRGNILKVIFETALIDDDQIVTLCKICTEVGVDFVKTSTGFGGGGATLEDVTLMKRSVGQGVQVKASGGIRDFDTAQAMIDAGATRLGVSAGIAIVTGAQEGSLSDSPRGDY
jgi:deoxyribose-phosphate aldolase